MDPRRSLSVPALYRLFRSLVTRPSRDRVLLDLLDLRPGLRLLDIGCGPGDFVNVLPAGVEYVGVDADSSYIASARRRLGDRGEFHVARIGASFPDGLGHFDRILADGILHHLDARASRALFELSVEHLGDEGLLATLDPCFAPDQTTLSRRLVRRDRGDHVRDADAYVQLAGEYFSELDSAVHHDLLRIPYSHLSMRCRDPRRR